MVLGLGMLVWITDAVITYSQFYFWTFAPKNSIFTMKTDIVKWKLQWPSSRIIHFWKQCCFMLLGRGMLVWITDAVITYSQLYFWTLAPKTTVKTDIVLNDNFSGHQVTHLYYVQQFDYCIVLCQGTEHSEVKRRSGRFGYMQLPMAGRWWPSSRL